MDERMEPAGSTAEVETVGRGAGPGAVPPREWVEVLSLLLVGSAVAIIGHYALMAWSMYDQVGFFGAGDPSAWELVLPVAAHGGSLLNAVVIAVALGLVLVAPGPMGPWGRAALTGVSIVGVVVAALALLGIVEAVRPGRGDGGVSFAGIGSMSTSATLLERVTETLRWIPGLVVGGLSAWMAWRNLNDTPAPAPVAPGVEDDGPEGFPEVDLGLDR